MLKIICAEYINLQENLSNEDKIILLKFLKECDTEQAAHLLLYGEMVLPDKINIVAEDFFGSIDNMMQLSQKTNSLNPIVAIKAAYKLAGPEAAKMVAKKFIPHAVLVAAIIATSIVLYKNYMTKAAKACKGKVDKSRCMVEYKMKAYGEQIKKLKKDMGLCKKAKDSGKCSKKVTNKINSINQKIQKQKSRL